MLAALECAEFAVDAGNDLAREIVRVSADRGRVHVLVAAERREAVRKDENRRPHFLLANEPRRALGDIVAERFPVGVRETGAGEADQVVEHREAALTSTFVVLRRQPHPELAHVGIVERIVLEDVRGVLEDDQGAGGGFGAFEGHGRFSVLSKQCQCNFYVARALHDNSRQPTVYLRNCSESQSPCGWSPQLVSGTPVCGSGYLPRENNVA